MWLFAIGQLGWSILSGIITNWLVYYYQPGESLLSQGQQIFITQGAVFSWASVIRHHHGVGPHLRRTPSPKPPGSPRFSDRCTHRLGRRMPFLRFAPIPFGIATVLVFVSPVDGASWVNNVFLFAMVLCFYLGLTCYCTPFNALIPELGRTQELHQRLYLYIGHLFIRNGRGLYLLPTIQGFFVPSMGMVASFRFTVGVLAAVAVVCMLVPSFAIDEHVYAVTRPKRDGREETW